MADIEITDEASLEAWLKTRPRLDAEIIAFRAAARVFPLWGRAMEEPWALYAAQKRKGDLTATPILRFLLTLSIFDHRDTDNFQEKISQSIAETISAVKATSSHYTSASASSAAFKSIDQAIGTKLSLEFASDSENFASAIDDFLEATRYSSPSLWRIVKKDAMSTADKKAGFTIPLWPTPAPDWFTTADRETRAIWAKDPDTWRFWEKWWDGVISGDMPFPPELLRDVALIEDGIWQAGPKAVAEAIDKLITARALAMTDNGESVEINPDTGKLRLVGADTLPPDIDRYARRKMAKALALFEGELSNQYRPLDAPLRVIRAALGDTENLPNELFDACASASRMTAILVETQSIPAPDQDPLIGEFVASLRETAADILAADTNTQDILTKRKAVMGSDALIAHAGDINIVVGQIVVISEGALQRLLPENADAALNPKAHPDDRNIGAYKLASRLLRVHRIIRELGGTIADYKELATFLMVLTAHPAFQSAIAAILKYLGLG
jgi:hypothetical protein